MKVPEERKKERKQMLLLSSGRTRLINLTLISGNPWQIILKNISVLMKYKKVMGIGQHGFLKRKFCLTNMVAFYDDFLW